MIFTKALIHTSDLWIVFLDSIFLRTIGSKALFALLSLKHVSFKFLTGQTAFSHLEARVVEFLISKVPRTYARPGPNGKGKKERKRRK